MSWLRDHDRRSGSSFGFGLPWNQIATMHRYVDDMLAISHHLCHDCLHAAFSHIFDDLTFTFQDSDMSGNVSWLDVVVNAFDGSSEFAPKDVLFPPVWDDFSSFARSFVLFRAARWSQLDLGDDKLALHAAELIVLLQESGAFEAVFKSLLFSGKVFAPECGLAQH